MSKNTIHRMLNSESPIELVVDRVAEAVAKAWDVARDEHVSVSDTEQAGFLSIAYRYLSLRQTAIYKLERVNHLRDVHARYRRPPSTDELYGEEAEPNQFLAVLFATMSAVLSSAALLAVFATLSWIAINIVTILDELNRFVVSGEAMTLIIFFAVPIASVFIAVRLFHKPLEYVFAGNDSAHWTQFQPHTSKQFESERAQILMMIGSPPDHDLNESLPETADAPNMNEDAVPVTPGITEFALSTGRVSIEDIGEDFRAAKRQHTIVFWVTFIAFLIVLASSVAAALVFNQDLQTIGGLGIISGVIGTFSYKILDKARLARVALTLFDSYVVELHQRMDDLAEISDNGDRGNLRAEAWTNFRVGLNNLYALEKRPKDSGAVREK